MISLTSPVRTWAHDLPAGPKLAALSLVTLGLFFVRDVAAMVLALTCVLALYASAGGTFLRAGWRQSRVLWPFVVVVTLWHLWTGDHASGAVLVTRMVAVVALANFVTMTTRVSDMLDVIHRLIRPLARIGVQPRLVELAFALVIRMTPVLIEKGGRLAEAWRARSARAVGWRVVLPFAVVALDDADHVAEALRARGGIEAWRED